MGEVLSTPSRLAAGALIVIIGGGAIAAERTGFRAADFMTTVTGVAERFGYSQCPDPPSQTELADTQRAIEAGLAQQGSHSKSHALRRMEKHVLSAPSAQAATDEMSTYTQLQLGFPTTLDIPQTQLDQKLNVSAYKQALLTEATFIDLLPEKLVRQIAIHRMSITNIGERTQTPHGMVMGGYDDGRDELVLDINGLGNPGFLIHEVLGHGLQDAECAGIIGHDAAFTQLNRPGFSYKALTNAMCLPPRMKPDEFASGYAQTGERDDVAETITHFMTDTAAARDDIKAHNILGQKTLLVLQRARQLMPGSARSLAHAARALAELEKQAPHSEAVVYTNAPLPTSDSGDMFAC